jgi:hypothetical protein
MTWNTAAAVTEVELTFTEVGPALTRVAVERRGWEQLTDEQLAEDCALPGGYLGGAYHEGWARILAEPRRCHRKADLAEFRPLIEGVRHVPEHPLEP